MNAEFKEIEISGFLALGENDELNFFDAMPKYSESGNGFTKGYEYDMQLRLAEDWQGTTELIGENVAVGLLDNGPIEVTLKIAKYGKI